MVVLLAPLAMMLAVVGPAKNLRVRKVQFLQFVQILAGGGRFELDYGVAVFVREVSEAITAGASGSGASRGAAEGLAAALRGRCVRGWRVDAAVVDRH